MTELMTIHGINSEAITAHTVARFTAALDQHQAHVKDVQIRLDDENGPKGGKDDQRCRVVVRLDIGGEIVVDERGQDLYAVISSAADRVKQAAGRQLHKVLDRRVHDRRH